MHSCVLEIQSILECHDQINHTHSGQAHPQIFWSTFNLCQFVSTCEKSGSCTDLFSRYGWLKNPAIWLAENISQEQNFSQSTAKNKSFKLSTNSVKLMTIFFSKFQKPFYGLFGPFGTKKLFSWKSGSITHNFFFLSGFSFTNIHKSQDCRARQKSSGLYSYTHKSFAFLHTTWHGFLAPCQKLKKTNDTIPIKHPKRLNDERKDRQTLFYWTLPATTQGPGSNSDQTLINYCRK